MQNLVAYNNSAPAGGGGVVLWQGVHAPDIQGWNGGMCGTVCPAGTVHVGDADQTDSMVCTPCAPGTFKSAGLGPCSACPAGSYSAAGASSCAACPDGSSSPPHSTDALNCSCSPGYTGPAGGPCAACGAGTYKATMGPEPCLPCPAG
eukprot:3460335-Rhodomonas_salina.1